MKLIRYLAASYIELAAIVLYIGMSVYMLSGSVNHGCRARRRFNEEQWKRDSAALHKEFKMATATIDRKWMRGINNERKVIVCTDQKKKRKLLTDK